MRDCKVDPCYHKARSFGHIVLPWSHRLAEFTVKESRAGMLIILERDGRSWILWPAAFHPLITELRRTACCIALWPHSIFQWPCSDIQCMSGHWAYIHVNKRRNCRSLSFLGAIDRVIRLPGLVSSIPSAESGTCAAEVTGLLLPLCNGPLSTIAGLRRATCRSSGEGPSKASLFNRCQSSFGRGGETLSSVLAYQVFVILTCRLIGIGRFHAFISGI